MGAVGFEGSVEAKPIPKAMTIAGSDSGGGAGIQADLKTFAAFGVYATSVVTAVTAQNTRSVVDFLEMPPALVKAQIDAVVTDIGADVVKTGMLASSAIIEVVAESIKRHSLTRVVVDPVMVAKSGDRLLRENAVEALRDLLIPLAYVVTPNIPEAEALLGRSIRSLDDINAAVRDLVAMGAKSAVVKGGHLDGPATDGLYDGQEFRAFTSQRLSTTSTHGTGCTFASAIAAGLANGKSVRDAVSEAKKYVTNAMKRSFPIGSGHGPLNHFHEMWDNV